jgi:hypothetical protein
MESAISQLSDKRMSKSQPIRWSALGAQLLPGRIYFVDRKLVATLLVLSRVPHQRKYVALRGMAPKGFVCSGALCGKAHPQ